MNANNNLDDAARIQLVHDKHAEIEAVMEAFIAEIETAIATSSRQKRDFIETTNELRNNISAHALGGPSRAAENAELIARLQQLGIDMKADGAARTASIVASEKIINGLMADFVDCLR